MGWQNSFEEADGKVESEGEDGSGDLHSPLTAAQTCGWIPQLL